jgi:hypothetical protein
MKKTLTLLFILMTMAIAACTDDNNSEYIVLTSLTIHPVEKDLYIGDKYQLSASVEPADVKLPKLKWVSSDTKIASVSNSGLVEVKADGVVTISVSYGSLSDDITLVISKIQDYTSFVVTIDTSNKLINCVAGYYTADGQCKKLGDLGELTRGVYSPEIRVNIDTLTRIYVFTNTATPLQFKNPYLIEKNKKNIIKVEDYTSAIDVIKWPE